MGCSNSKKTSEASKESKIVKSSPKKSETVKSVEQETKVDFNNAADFESALKEGQDTTGKTVTFMADNIVPDGALGYTVWAGEHLNFVSTEVLGWKTGESHTVKVTKVASAMGSFMISFETIK